MDSNRKFQEMKEDSASYADKARLEYLGESARVGKDRKTLSELFTEEKHLDILKKPSGPGVYEILNLVSSKAYVGSSTDVKQRIRKHRHLLKNGEHWIKELQYDWSLLGESNFSFRILEIFDSEELLEQVEYLEISDRFEHLYNIRSLKRGYKFSPSQIKDKSKRMKKLASEVSGYLDEDRKGLNKAVKLFNIDGIHIRNFKSQKSLSKFLNISRPKLSIIINKKSGKYKNFIIVKDEG